MALAAGLVATGAGIEITGHAGSDPEGTRLLVTATLGLPLLFALGALADRRGQSTGARLLLPLPGVAVLVAIWLLWRGWTGNAQLLRYAQFSIAFHLLAAFVPFVGKNEPNGFWQYNKALFIRFLTATLYTGVLYGGLAIALTAIDKLFGVNIKGEHYAALWMLFAFGFNPWFFLGGVPADIAALEKQTEYPNGLRVFTQYVLVPLVAIYVVILTLYLGKVLVTRQWPNGWIGYLVSSVATVGILAWLLVRPLEERPEYAWVKAYTRGFYIALIPAIVMLWLAIWKRVSQYGITERRYFLIVLSVWLAGIALYYTLTRSRNIRLIPSTLCAIALVTLVGPWGAYSVSQHNQTARLVAVLTRNELLVNGRLHASARDVTAEDRQTIGAGLLYLLKSHGPDAVTPFLADSLRMHFTRDTLRAQYSEDRNVRAIMLAVGLEYVDAHNPTPNEYFSFYAPPLQEPLVVEGYTHLVHLSLWRLRDSLKIADGAYLHLAPDSLGLRLSRDGTTVLTLSLRDVVDSAVAIHRRTVLQGQGPTPFQPLRAEATSGNFAALLIANQVAGYRNPKGAPRVTAIESDLLIRIK